MIVAWVQSVKLGKTLLDGSSLVELISRRKLNQIVPKLRVNNNGYLRVSLATDKTDILTDYIIIPINIEGVEAFIKA